MNRIHTLVLGVALASGCLAAVPVRADHGDPSTRPDPVPAAFSATGNSAFATIKQDALEIALTMTPAQPKLGDLIRVGLTIHDPERNADFSGAIKVTILDGEDKELASGSALGEGGQGSFLYLLADGGIYRFRFEFDAEIPAWTPTSTKPGATPQATLKAELPAKGRVQCEITVEGSKSELPLPYIVGGGVALLLAAMMVLRKRSS